MGWPKNTSEASRAGIWGKNILERGHRREHTLGNVLRAENQREGHEDGGVVVNRVLASLPKHDKGAEMYC